MPKKHDTQRRWVEGSTVGAGLLLAMALYVMVNYLSLRHFERFDWTASSIYTLSEKSKNVVRELDQEVEAVVLMNPSSSELFTAVNELLARYESANPAYFKKRLVDRAKDFLEAQRLVGEYQIGDGNVIVLRRGAERRVIQEYELAKYDYSGARFGEPPSLEAFMGEEKITSALLSMIEDRKPKVLFVAGHGEAPIDDPSSPRALGIAQELLGRDNFALETWTSLSGAAVPEGTDLVVVAGPSRGFLEPELAAFSAYLDGGGRMLWLLDPALAEEGSTRLADLGLNAWMGRYGLSLADDVVLDPSSEVAFFGPGTIYTVGYGEHVIVEPLEQTNTPVLFPGARSIAPSHDAPEGVEITPLVATTDEGWGETRLDAHDPVYDAGEDVAGPVTLAVAVRLTRSAEADTAGPEGRLVVVGDSDFATDSSIQSAANSLLTLNIFNWLVEREQLIAIEPRRPEETHLSLSDGEMLGLLGLVLGLLPGLAILAGITVFLQRRR